MDPKAAPHRFRFYRAGGVDQVRLDRGADLIHLDQLDQKLWVALSCPVKGLEFDEKTLAILDSDRDGRVRVPEILAAVRWIGRVLRNPDELLGGGDGVALSSIDGSTPEGKVVLASAKRLLKSLGMDGAAQVTVADSMRTAELMAKATHNGDGIVPPETLADPTVRAVAAEIVACTGGAPDRSGRTGFAKSHLDAFLADCAAFDAWQTEGEREAKTLLPLGAATADAAAAVQAIKAKVDDYFARCRMVAFDARSAVALNREESAWLALAARDLTITADEVRSFPLATVAAGKALPLAVGVNPAWEGAIAELRSKAVEPLLGKDRTALTEADWRGLEARLAPWLGWQARRKGASVAALGAPRVRQILAANHRAELEAAIAADAAVASEIDAIGQVEKLTRLKRDLHALLNNFVTLYFDGRACDLCVQVADAAKHATLAPMSKSYLAYVDCTRPSGEKMQIAAAFTAGSDDNLFIGRNGLFYDRKGRDWDATIAKIVSAPISIRQAFWSPYKKLVRYVEETIAKRAAAADEAASSKLQTTTTTVGDATRTGVAPKPKFDIGVIAALGVAVGGISAALAGLFSALAEMNPLSYPALVAGVILGISGPSMLIAALKLRQRNLGPLLDANGWAVNVLTKINIPLGGALTDTAAIPPGAERSLRDPYAVKRSPWPRVALVAALLGLAGYGSWRTNHLHRWFPRWIPAHHPETRLTASTESVAPGGVVTFTVPSGSAALAWSLDGAAPELLPVADLKAALTVPADAKPGTRIVVTDASETGNQVVIEVVAGGG
jgi:hypothetical protein